jgi:hypothetical protein
VREYFRHRCFVRHPAFARKFRAHLRASIYLGISAGILVILSGSLALFAQRILHYQFDLDLLVRQKRYIELERDLKATQELSASDRAFYSGILANRKNEVSESIRLLEPLARTKGQASVYRAEVVLCTLADDYAKSFRYGDAADTYSLLSRLPGYKDDESGCHAELEAERWELLRGAPAQSTHVSNPFVVDENRNAAGFIEVAVQAPNFSDHWILDTGANLSAITRTVADQLGLKLSNDSSTAQGSNGIFVRVHTAVISEIQLGGATIRNMAVLVFEDRDLVFPQIPYELHGSIGFPVLESLGRITFHVNGKLGAREPTRAEEVGSSNLYLEGFTVLIQANVADEDHLMTLDTGATGTFMSEQYYQRHKEDLNAEDLRELELVGAGGSTVLPAYLQHDVRFRMGGACVVLNNLVVLTEPTGLPDDFWGNVGQGTVRLFGSYTLDFRTMTLSAEGQVMTGKDIYGCAVR